MQISVTFRQMDASDALKAYAQEKMDRLNRYIPSPLEADVVLSTERYLQVADLSLTANGVVVRGEDKSDDMYKSIDRAVEKIERQLKKLRQKVRRHAPLDGVRAYKAKGGAPPPADVDMGFEADEPEVPAVWSDDGEETVKT
jgi:putative sigma-54 modulation protein